MAQHSAAQHGIGGMGFELHHQSKHEVQPSTEGRCNPSAPTQCICGAAQRSAARRGMGRGCVCVGLETLHPTAHLFGRPEGVVAAGGQLAELAGVQGVPEGRGMGLGGVGLG